MASREEDIEKLADILECVAVTVYEILGAALTNAFTTTAIGANMGTDTSNLREGARNIAHKLDAWDKLQ